MRDLGTPVYSKSFFGNILEAFPDTTRIFAVYHETRMIAAGIGSWFKDTFEVPWASSISDHNALCPNNMLYWEAIRFAIRNGFKKFNFGRSTPHQGTYNFKKQWGALPVQLYWQYLIDGQNSIPDLNPTNPRYQTAIRIWQCLPLRVTRVLGPMIVRNIP
jgi:FemAB-related protein (PEP-CTERM system-associated)